MIIQVSDLGRIKTKSLQKIFQNKIEKGSNVVTDSLRSYHGFFRSLEITWKKIPSKKKEVDGFTLDKINYLHSRIGLFLSRFRGVSYHFLQGYMVMYQMNERYKKTKSDTFIENLFVGLCGIKTSLKCAQIDRKQMNWLII